MSSLPARSKMTAPADTGILGSANSAGTAASSVLTAPTLRAHVRGLDACPGPPQAGGRHRQRQLNVTFGWGDKPVGRCIRIAVGLLRASVTVPETTGAAPAVVVLTGEVDATNSEDLYNILESVVLQRPRLLIVALSGLSSR